MIEAYCKMCNKLVNPKEGVPHPIGGIAMRWDYHLMECGHIFDNSIGEGIMYTEEQFREKTGWKDPLTKKHFEPWPQYSNENTREDMIAE